MTDQPDIQSRLAAMLMRWEKGASRVVKIVNIQKKRPIFLLVIFVFGLFSTIISIPDSIDKTKNQMRRFVEFVAGVDSVDSVDKVDSEIPVYDDNEDDRKRRLICALRPIEQTAKCMANKSAGAHWDTWISFESEGFELAKIEVYDPNGRIAYLIGFHENRVVLRQRLTNCDSVCIIKAKLVSKKIYVLVGTPSGGSNGFARYMAFVVNSLRQIHKAQFVVSEELSSIDSSSAKMKRIFNYGGKEYFISDIVDEIEQRSEPDDDSENWTIGIEDTSKECELDLGGEGHRCYYPMKAYDISPSGKYLFLLRNPKID